ncbi:hypothetical protein B0H16DRAFT_1482735 [Mycena metata]|uniref:Uncharacterized protein n=1 Tax=Mycena metata TaxID=1033252 RepID=A0AAD7M715_9AGAR|nr:hypothetical protein B0H16DRAFT_1482735 [Mycena metata]
MEPLIPKPLRPAIWTQVRFLAPSEWGFRTHFGSTFPSKLGSWIEIFGTSLRTMSRTWRSDGASNTGTAARSCLDATPGSSPGVRIGELSVVAFSSLRSSSAAQAPSPNSFKSVTKKKNPLRMRCIDTTNRAGSSSYATVACAKQLLDSQREAAIWTHQTQGRRPGPHIHTLCKETGMINREAQHNVEAQRRLFSTIQWCEMSKN